MRENKAQVQKLAFLVLTSALLAILTSIYVGTFHSPFEFDDQHAILDNASIRDISNLPLIFTSTSYSTSLPKNRTYRPVVTASVLLDYHFSGLDPKGYHRSMYVVFLAQLLILFLLLKQICRKALKDRSGMFYNYAALLCTAIYGFNTVLAETLNYISARSDSYSTFFVVAALALFVLDGWPKQKYLYLIPMTLALLSKETGITVPALIFSYQFLFSAQNDVASRLKDAFKECLPSAIFVIVYLFAYFYLGANPYQNPVSRISYFVTQIYVVAHYFLMFILPVNLTADSDLTIFTNFLDERVLLGMILHLVLISAIVFGIIKRKFAPLSFGLLWFYISLAPTSSLIPIDDLQNDHRMFFPVIGLALALGWVLLIGHQKLTQAGYALLANFGTVVFCVLYLGGHSYGLSVRNETWRSKENLWHDVTIKSPLNPRGLMNYGIALMEKGDFKGARGYYEKTMKFWPIYSYLHINLGVVSGAEGKTDEADREFQIAIQEDPMNPTCYYFYANWLNSQKRYSDALRLVETALMLSPGHAGAQALRGTILLATSNSGSKVQ